MSRYLLDTNIVSHLAEEPVGLAARHMRALADAVACTSIIVAAEIRFGLAKRQSRALVERVEAVLESLEIVPFEAPAEEIYGDLRAELGRAGKPIGGNDLFIAAHALALDCILVTANEREFRRVPGLKVENWLA